ncbi:hypothetical protein [Methylobacterium sp.]|uniref:hypothetical protein n=1 Tax=Methylobacterium sp. TaxID=409 RepID=UPI0025DAE11A|nr:hypothetical protein [Methylobacterium sp.]MBY0260128.1 hypothetical protein [Methylobacterium sp.]
MSMLDRLFGKKPRTPAIIEAEIAAQRAGIADSRARIEKAKADRQAAIEAFDDTRHKAADEASAAAGRDIERREHALGLLIPALAAAVKGDELAALKARVEAARKRVGDAPKLLDRYEVLAAELAGVAAGLNAIDREIADANAVLTAARKADPDADLPRSVEGVSARFRSEPDVVTPDQEIEEWGWDEPDLKTGVYRPATVYNDSDRPQNSAARKVKRTRIVPGKVKPGRTLPSPTYGLILPPARLDQAPFWPVR